MCDFIKCPGLDSTDPSRKLKICGRCRKKRYCSVGCQRGDWKGGHRQACRSHLTLNKDLLKQDVVLAPRSSLAEQDSSEESEEEKEENQKKEGGEEGEEGEEGKEEEEDEKDVGNDDNNNNNKKKKTKYKEFPDLLAIVSQSKTVLSSTGWEKFQRRYEKYKKYHPSIIVRSEEIREGLKTAASTEWIREEESDFNEQGMKEKIKKFVWKTFGILEKEQQWQLLPLYLKAFAIVPEFFESAEDFRVHNRTRTMPLIVTADGLLRLLRADINNQPLKIKALQHVLSFIKKDKKLQGQFAIDFFRMGGPSFLWDMIHSGPTCYLPLCKSIHSAIFRRVAKDTGGVVTNCFVMQCVDEFQDNITPILKLKHFDLLKNQNKHLQVIKSFLKHRGGKETLYPFLLSKFVFLSLEFLRQDNEPNFRQLVLVGELVRQCFQLGMHKFFRTLELIGIRFWLETIEDVVDLHKSLFKLMYYTK